MKTNQFFQVCVAMLLFGMVRPGGAAESESFARIKSVRIDKANVVVEVEATASFTKITLESSARLGRRAWEPRGVKVLTNATESVNTVTFDLPLSPAIEILRVRGDLAENSLPGEFFSGTNSFTLPNG